MSVPRDTAAAAAAAAAGEDAAAAAAAGAGAADVRGATLAGRWRVEALLGRGAVGAVWAARDLVLHRRVALKVLHPEVAARPLAAERFRREALLLARLRHDNAVHIYDHGVDAGRFYIAMELLDGTPLDALVAAAPGRRFAPERAAALLAPVLDVLERAHALGIVHRDLKPANVLVVAAPGGGERPVVVDFGLAVLLSDARGDGGAAGGGEGDGDEDGAATRRLTLQGHLHGTPAYMPPEQCLGRAVDARSDLYAAGCCLYELLTGAPPFGDAEPAQVLAAQMHQVPVPPSRLDPPVTLPAALEELLLAALAKLPAQRPASARAMKDALLAAVGAGPPGAGAPRSAARAPRMPRPAAAAAEPADLGGPERPAGTARAPAVEPDAGPVVGIVEPPAAGTQGVSAALSLAGFAVEPLGPGDLSARGALGAVVVVPPAEAGDPVAAAARWVSPGGPRVLLCGPESDVALMARAIEAGVYDYVALPLDAAELVKKVGRALRVKR
ncbi:MAG TPA: serine/threonine-protein kinase [Myxococcota bacterium]|nr:serine/threonine-protein kinase [Myxococcota bacterium]